MGEVQEYPNGTFCWVHLGTPDVEGAKGFYSALLGWETEDVPGGSGDTTTTIARLHGREVAEIHGHPGTERAEWWSYVSVDDVDAAAARARELGAEVLKEPVDAGVYGRVAHIRDPAGARLTLWQSKDFPGARRVNDIGTWCWNELVTPDVEAARAFYRDLFGWESQISEPPVVRGSFQRGEQLIGGVHAPFPGEPGHPRWSVAFAVEDAGTAAERAAELGSSVVIPVMDIPVGKFTVVNDPAGAEITLSSFPAGAIGGVDGSPPLPQG
jgi:predicted enzyme related to lactoylglutathione lyase